MDTFFNGFSRQVTKVTILSTYNLVNDCLREVLESDKELKVLDSVSTSSQLIQKISQNMPDVVLICLMESEGKNINMIPDIFKAAPHTKVVILSTPNSLLDQPEGGGHGLEPDGGGHGDPFRSVVEPCGGAAGHRPDPSYRSDQEYLCLSDDL